MIQQRVSQIIFPKDDEDGDWDGTRIRAGVLGVK